MKKKLIIISLLFFTISVYSQNEQLLHIKNNLLINSSTDKPDLLQTKFEKKSPGLAILYSILLPGMGEYYADNFSTGQYFTMADGLFWSVLAGISIYGSNKEDDYRALAKSFGGVNLDGKDDQYFASIGIYENLNDYNREKQLNRDFDEVYSETTHFWSWQNNRRSEYRDLWVSSENAKNNVRFAVGALILNRIVSAIFAVRSVNSYNKRQNSDFAWKINFNLDQKLNLPSRLVMNASYSF